MSRFPSRPSKREVRNTCALYDALANGEPLVVEAAKPQRTGPRGKQPESQVNKVVQQWAALHRGVLYRNRRGMVQLASGAMMPIGLGPNGFGDLCGYFTLTITPEMIGRKVAVFSMIESKTDTGRLATHQIERIEEVRDAGGIAGVARNAEDAEVIYQRWVERQEGR